MRALKYFIYGVALGLLTIIFFAVIAQLLFGGDYSFPAGVKINSLGAIVVLVGYGVVTAIIGLLAEAGYRMIKK